jgi:hypothetical protein
MKRVQEQKWNDAFVFFKHEDEGVGPKLAAQFLGLGKSNSHKKAQNAQK